MEGAHEREHRIDINDDKVEDLFEEMLNAGRLSPENAAALSGVDERISESRDSLLESAAGMDIDTLRDSLKSDKAFERLQGSLNAYLDSLGLLPGTLISEGIDRDEIIKAVVNRYVELDTPLTGTLSWQAGEEIGDYANTESLIESYEEMFEDSYDIEEFSQNLTAELYDDIMEKIWEYRDTISTQIDNERKLELEKHLEFNTENIESILNALDNLKDQVQTLGAENQKLRKDNADVKRRLSDIESQLKNTADE